MAWSSEFKQALGAAGADHHDLWPRYLIEWVQIPAGQLRVFGGNIRLSSWDAGLGYAPLIMADGNSFNSGQLDTRSWASQPGGFRLAFDGWSAAGLEVRQFAQRGQALVLKVGLPLAGVYHYEPVLLVQLTDIGCSGGRWYLECRGLEGALNSRLTTEVGKSLLCHDLASTETNGAYDGGGTLAVDDVTGFRGDGLAFGATGGVVRVTADDGSTYYVSYTGTSGNSFTGCTSGILGTTYSATDTNLAVTEVAYTKGHPTQVMARVLTSTGATQAGTTPNGPDDVLPASWGYGISADLVDDRDMLLHRQYTQPTTGADDLDWIVADQVEDGQALINSWLNPAGYFLTQHQGRITCRAALLPWATQTSGAYHIYDFDIRDWSYQQWAGDSANRAEFSRCRIFNGDTGTASPNGVSAASAVDHHPSRDANDHLVQGLLTTTTNEAAIATELVGRLKQWDIRTPEVITLELHGWRAAQASKGDTMKLTSSLFPSRDGRAFVGRDALVTRCNPNWFDATTDVELHFLPADETVPWRAP